MKKHISMRNILKLMLMMIIILLFFYQLTLNITSVSQTKAISLIQNSYPEYANYPNDNLAPQSIRTEQSVVGWYVAFVQEGSGRPIISATCFFVDNKGNINKIANFLPEMNETDFSINTCQGI